MNQNTTDFKIPHINNGIEAIRQRKIREGVFDIAPAYLFSTENIRDSFATLDLKDKSVLLVAGSGDHAFASLGGGTKKLTNFDINILQECVFQLKYEMIKTLSYSDFRSYFISDKNNNKYMNQEVLAPVMQNASPELVAFLDRIYESFASMYSVFNAAPFFRMINVAKAEKIPYLDSKDEYNSLQEKLRQTSFQDMNFRLDALDSVSKNETEKFDFIHLSNICAYYIKSLGLVDGFARFNKDIVDPLINKNLNKNGSIVISYVWGIMEQDKYQKNIFDAFKHTFKSNKDVEYSVTEFESMRTSFEKDALLTVTKKR